MINLQTAINIFKSIAELEQLDKEAQACFDKNASLLDNRHEVVHKLERLAIGVQDTLEELAKLPSISFLAPSLNEKVLSTINLSYDAQDMTIFAIAKLCSKKVSGYAPHAQKESFQQRLNHIAQIHVPNSPHNKDLLSCAMRNVQVLENDKSLDWGLIDRLMHVFFTIVQAQKQYYHPESKKNR